MKTQTINHAVAEARRFLERAIDLKRATKKPDWTDSEGHQFFPSAPKEHGALRRASIDLTRALAEMRKP